MTTNVGATTLACMAASPAGGVGKSWPNRLLAPKNELKSILLGAKTALEPIMKIPLDIGRQPSRAKQHNDSQKKPGEILIRKDAVAQPLFSLGRAEIASIGPGQEVVFSQVMDLSWEIAGTGDFNGDGETDILWRYYGTSAYQGLNDTAQAVN